MRKKYKNFKRFLVLKKIPRRDHKDVVRGTIKDSKRRHARFYLRLKEDAKNYDLDKSGTYLVYWISNCVCKPFDKERDENQ